MLKGIDVSKYQNGLKISDVKNAGYNFVIIRGGFTGYGVLRTKHVDPSFENFYAQCKALNMPCGVYYYSCATNAAEGKAEAEFLYENSLKGKKFEYPIYIDVEETRWQLKDKTGVTDAIIAFCDTLEKLGYYVGVYASLDWFNNKIDTNRLDRFTKWVACWSKQKPTFKYNAFDIWQYSDNGVIGSYIVDTNFAYRDFPTIIKSGGNNGYTKTTPAKPAKKSVDEIAKEVLDNKWGVGQERIDRLKAAGYDPTAVQKRVNEMILHKKSIDEIAREVIKGEWGNGAVRKSKLTKAGYDYEAVQKRVKELMNK